MTARLYVKSFVGRSFYVADAPSLGFVSHTNSTAPFDEAEPVLCELERIKPGEIFIDVGAQYGSYTLPALAMGARVLAFEPTDYASETLRASVKANGWEARCTVWRAALYDGTPYPKELHAEVFTKHYPSAHHAEHRLDDVLATEPGWAGHRIHWMKLDVEGAELGVLNGARETLQRDRPSLLIEDHDGITPGVGCAVSDYPASIDSSRKIHEILADLGYAIRDVPWGCNRKYIVATHNKTF